MGYIHRRKVMFKDCDPAGIVFFPRYFEMLNDTVECFFDEVLGCPFEALHKGHALPTARMETQFKAPSRLGDRLEIGLTCTRLGRSSLDLEFVARCGDDLRLSAASTLVQVGPDGRPVAWAGALRDALEDQVKGTE
ncbi:MAG: acyl-CoA thioesterase [Rhodobacterales bacterium]